MIDIIFKIIIFLIALLIARYVIPWLKDKNIYNYAVIAVQAAEQIFNTEGKGAEKFEYVKNWMHDKFKISEDDLKKIIESAVYELNSAKEGK